ncbi:hypothetical protein [Priestia abyssalis]|uniref:hypothetical protein n=1 Tax=Priestia abyssalis TaxID=1221450 RepID=UPI001473D8C2|nr:hypothetical protein [Priestia abyssalis]
MEKDTFEEMKRMNMKGEKKDALEISSTGYGLVSHLSNESETMEGQKTEEL